MPQVTQKNPKHEREKLHRGLKEIGFIKKTDFENFESRLIDNPDQRKVFYDELKKENVFKDKFSSYEEFDQHFFSDVKKKPIGGPGPVASNVHPVQETGSTQLPGETPLPLPDMQESISQTLSEGAGDGSTSPVVEVGEVAETPGTEKLPNLIEQHQQQQLAKDDPGYLGKVWRQISNFTKQFQASMANYLASYSDDSSYYGAVANQLADQDQIRKDLIEFAQRQKADIDPNALEQDFFAAMESAKNGDPTKLGEWATNAILQIGEQGIASALTGGTALFAQGIGDTYGDAIEKRVAQGESLEQALKSEDAQLSAQLFGLGMGILEKVGLDKILGKIGTTSAATAISNKIRGTLNAALTEGLTEAGQETAQEIGSSVGAGMSSEQITERLKSGDFWKQLANAALAGAFGGGSLRGSSELLTPTAKPATPAKPAEAEQQPVTQQQEEAVPEKPVPAPQQEEPPKVEYTTENKQQVEQDLSTRIEALQGKRSTPKEKFDFLESLPDGTIISHEGEQRVIVRQGVSSKHGSKEFLLIPQIYNEDKGEWEDNNPALQVIRREKDGRYWGEFPTVMGTQVWTDFDGNRHEKSPTVTLPDVTHQQKTQEEKRQAEPEPEPAPKPIKAKDNIGRRVNINGQSGVVKMDEEGNVVVETRDRIFEIGKDQEEDLRQFGVEDTRSFEVSADESGQINVNIDGEDFSHVSTNTNQDGEVTSITVRNAEGQERTIRDKSLALDVDIEINKIPTIQQIEQQGQEEFEQAFEEELQNVEVDESHINPVNNVLDMNMTDTITNALDKAPSKMTEQEKLQIQLWADDVVQRLEKLPQTEYRDNMIDNVLNIYDTVSNFKKISNHGKRKEKVTVEAGANAPVATEKPASQAVEESKPTPKPEPKQEQKVEPAPEKPKPIPKPGKPITVKNRYNEPVVFQDSTVRSFIESPTNMPGEYEGLTKKIQDKLDSGFDEKSLDPFIKDQARQLARVLYTKQENKFDGPGVTQLASEIENILKENYFTSTSAAAAPVKETPAKQQPSPQKETKVRKLKPVAPTTPSKPVTQAKKKVPGVKVKRGNNTYEVANDGGRLIITRNGKEIPSHERKGGRVRQNSTYERVKREYEKTVNYDKGETAPETDLNTLDPEVVNNYIAQHSNNPFEIIYNYMLDRETPNEIDHKKEILSQYVFNIERADLFRAFGKANVSEAMKTTYVAPKGDGSDMSAIAEAINTVHQLNITRQDVINFIEEHPWGFNPETERNRETESQKRLRARFTELTGLDINDRVYAIALEQMEKKYHLDTEDQKVKAYLSKDYETTQEAEREFYRQLEKEGFTGEEDILPSEARGSRESEEEVSSRSEPEEIREQIESNKATGTNDPGIVALAPGMKALLDIPAKVARFYRKYLRSRGYFPQSVFNEHIEKKGRMAAHAKEARRLSSKLASVARKAYGKNLEANLPTINEALKDVAVRNTLPADVRDAVAAMRDKIKQISQAMIDEGIVSGKLHAVMDQNLDTYLNRSYRIHDDKKFQNSLRDDQNWAKFIKPQVLNRARAFFRNHYQEQGYNYPSDRIDGIIRNFLIRQTEKNDVAGGNAGKVGRKNLGVLKHRKDIPKELRDLMGEYLDPSVNFGKSVMKAAQILENHRFLRAVRKDGLGKYLFKGKKPPNATHVEQITAEADRAMFPLNGLWTTPEIKEMFDSMDKIEFQGDGLMSKAVRTWLGVNGYVKMAKTVFNPTTHVRNWMGGGFFATLNGYWRGKHIGKATLATLNDQFGNSKKWNDYFEKLLKLNIVDSNVDYGFMREAIEQANKYPDNFDAMTDNIAKRLLKKAGRQVQKAYQNEDNFWKIYAFENEKARYRQFFDNETALEKHAAEIVRDVVPNYNMLGRATQRAKYLPFTGSFLSFPAEIIRTTSNAVRITLNDFKEGRRAAAAERGAGLLFTSTITGAAAYTFMQMFDIDDEEDEAVRRFVAPWDKDAHLMYSTRIDDGRIRFVNFSYTDPYSYLKDPVRLLFKVATGKRDMRESAISALRTLASPFLSEEILVEKILDVRSNKKSNSGAEVYNPEDELDQQLLDIYDYVSEATEPGVFRSLRRVYLAQIGRPNEYGRVYNLQDEIQSVILGLRPVTIDVRQSLGFKFRRLNNRLSDARAIYTSVRNSRGEVTKKEIDEAYERANRIYKKILDEYKKDYDAAVLLRVPEGDIFKIMKDNKVAKKNMGFLAGKTNFVDLQK